MSHEVLAQVVERASSDGAFRAQLKANPDRVLAVYELTDEERAAVLSSDSGGLQPLGVDARITKIDNLVEDDGSVYQSVLGPGM